MSMTVVDAEAPATEASATVAPPVFVMNLYYTGLGIARNLRNKGVTVIGLSSEADAPGERSRFFERVHRVPSSADEPDALYEALMRIGRERRDRPVLFPTRDADILFLHRHRDELSRHFRVAQSSVVPALLDKLKLAELAGRCGVDSPRTVVLASQSDVDRYATTLRFPVVVKPRSAHQWRDRATWLAVGARKAFLVESADELRHEYCKIESFSPEVLVQEYVAGIDSDIVVCCCYVDDAGRDLGHFTARKQRQNPPLFGTGCVVEITDVPDIVEPSLALLRASGYAGLAEVEFKRDAKSGAFQLIEVNPRHWDQHQLGNAVGVNLSWIAYQSAIGRPPPPVAPQYRAGEGTRWIAEREAIMLVVRNAYVQWRSVRGGAQAALSEAGQPRGAGDVLRTMMRDLRYMFGSRKLLAIVDGRDPVPGVLLSWRLARELLRAGIGKARGVA